MLEVKNLNVSVAGRKILNDFSLTVKDGEVAAIMGPNGTGKSTLSYVIAGKKDYEVHSGEVLLNGVNLLELEPDVRAANGPVSRLPISAGNPRRRDHDLSQGGAERAAQAARRSRTLHARLHEKGGVASDKLGIKSDMMKRALNVGFSGGEKKRMEILQMALLEPSFGILDETDSGLDIDALRIVSEGVNSLRDPKRGFLVITHYQRLLDYIVPDTVHVMSGGKIVRTGGKELALELEKSGYAEYASEAAAA